MALSDTVPVTVSSEIDMGVFAVTKIEENERIFFGKYKDLQEAKKEGQRIYELSAEKMIISVIEADFEENDKITGTYNVNSSFQ